MSEQGYMHRRVQVEVCWFIALSDAGFAEFKPLSPGARTYLLGLVKNFSEADAVAIKEIEKTTNHDVKAVEYWIKSKFEARPELRAASEFVHFACTSEDINNTSHALQLKGAREQVLLPALDG
jgi:adenylosuccinate lyase